MQPSWYGGCNLSRNQRANHSIVRLLTKVAKARPFHITPGEHHPNPPTDQSCLMSEQGSQCHRTRGLDHKLESFIRVPHCLNNFLFFHHKESGYGSTENRESQFPKTRSKAIGKRVGVGHGNDTVLPDRVDCIQSACRLTGKDAHARAECLCRQTETREQASTTDWRQYNVQIGYLIDKLNHDRSLTGYDERIVKRMNYDRSIIIHNLAELGISTTAIIDHMYLSTIAQNSTMLHDRERFGHDDMRGGSLKTTSQRKSLPMIP